jgi:hypothetical protein
MDNGELEKLLVHTDSVGRITAGELNGAGKLIPNSSLTKMFGGMQ